MVGGGGKETWGVLELGRPDVEKEQLLLHQLLDAIDDLAGGVGVALHGHEQHCNFLHIGAPEPRQVLVRHVLDLGELGFRV